MSFVGGKRFRGSGFSRSEEEEVRWKGGREGEF
jgi:hypothetical protein